MVATARRTVIEVPAEYRTSDLYFAAFAIANQRRLLRTEKKGARTIFFFDAEVQSLTTSWLDTTGVVSAQTFATAIKNLKQLVSFEL